MKSPIFILIVSSFPFLAALLPGSPSLADSGSGPVVGAVSFAKDFPDTIYLMGGPDRQDGDFQNDLDPTLPDDEGWQLPYLAEPPLWHIDTFNAELLDPGQVENHAMWCGKLYPPCPGEAEANGGYEPGLDEWLEWTGTVADPALATEVRLTAVLNYDTEPGYDYLYLEVAGAGGFVNQAFYNGSNKSGGVFVPVDADHVFTVDPSDYQGAGGNEIRLRWRFVSDGGFDDLSCLYPSEGAAQIDNIAVSFDQGEGPILQTFDDFEAGSPIHWLASRSVTCGYAKVWPRLDDAGFCDPANQTPQLAFIDDGTQCDGTPSFGTDLTYGPDGYVVNCEDITYYPTFTGAFWSPVMVLPDVSVYESIRVEYDAYLDQCSGAVRVRTSSDGGTSWTGWSNASYGGAPEVNWRVTSSSPLSQRYSAEFHGAVPVGADRIQVALSTIPTGNCSVPSPAPYFDNIAVKLYGNSGPILNEPNSKYIYLSDNFPAAGEVDTGDLAANNVILNALEETVSLARTGSALVGPPELHWVLKANPLFDPYRTSLPANPIVGQLVIGGTNPAGYISPKYRVEFPQDGFLYPGDEFRFYWRVQDDVAGDIATVTLPADTTGFSDFTEDQTGLAGPYPQRFRFHALPTLAAAHPDSQPKILIWDASANAEETDELMLSLAQLGYRPGRDYDILRRGNLGQGIFSSIATGHFGYTTILAAWGGNRYMSDSNLGTWLGLGGRNLLQTGNNIGTANPGSSAPAEAIIGAASEAASVRPFIDDQNVPGLTATSAVPGITVPLVADGCDLPGFDALALRGTGQALYQFTAPGGSPGSYPYLGGIYNYLTVEDARVVTMPVTFSRLVSPDRFGGGLPARTVFLDQLLTFFGHAGSHAPSPVTTGSVFTVEAYPNPFNPRTTIAFTLPDKSPVFLQIYDLSGRLVNTLLNGEVHSAGPNSAIWTGQDKNGRSVAAGVYFYRLTAGPNVSVARLTLVK